MLKKNPNERIPMERVAKMMNFTIEEEDMNNTINFEIAQKIVDFGFQEESVFETI